MFAGMATLFLSTGVTQANPVSAGEEVTEKHAAALALQKKVTITGVVKDALGPVVGANVVEKGTTNGTVTDMEGRFSLQVSSNAVLIISYIGYIDQAIPVNGKSSFTVLLKEDSQALDEVVVVGYGTQKKVNMTGAFAGAQAEHVSFSYADEEVLHDLSLTIPEKKIVGITGRSGSGKSTFLRLLMRFWDVNTGTIRFGEEDIRRVNTATLRAQESLVTQETELFNDTIENNIRIAKRDATREEVEAACKKAALDGFIRSLPKGYDTPVGELGGALSGGERQRIGVARAFLHDAPFLLLDEPTSNLDSLNEGVILKAVRAECRDKTVLLVSHRKSTMAAADVTYSVESGRLS